METNKTKLKELIDYLDLQTKNIIEIEKEIHANLDIFNDFWPYITSTTTKLKLIFENCQSTLKFFIDNPESLKAIREKFYKE